ncbi:hypothetical protein BFINE_19480 [Bacteroides finegoldii DSM 17565]|nr:hypothetical protein BFINE_19480 [Bacteroides finegoldii DSM 17565]
MIEKVIKEEEESFLRTLETGIRLLDKTMEDTKAAGKTEISGKDAFTLYDTFGFPLDLTELILRENGMIVNIEEFNEEMQQQKQRARNAAAIETGDWITLKEGRPNSSVTTIRNTKLQFFAIARSGKKTRPCIRLY